MWVWVRDYLLAHSGTILSEDAVRKWRHKGLEYWEQQGICHESSKRNRHDKYPSLEATLFIWMKQLKSLNQISKCPRLVEKFKTRFHLRCFEFHGEAASADMHGVGFALQVLPRILKEYDAKTATTWMKQHCIGHEVQTRP
ncbi:hypothetical protein EMCRGX_G018269 [Ephydatia muelleri]